MRTFDGFFDTLGELDWLAILVASVVVGFVVAMIFYGPVFGKAWAAAAGQTYSLKFDPTRDILGFVLQFIFQIGVAFLGAADDIEHSIVTAIVAGLILIGSGLYSQTIYLKRNRVAVLIDIAFVFFAIAVGGYIQGLMA